MEVIVLQHLEHSAEPAEADSASSYNEALDLTVPAPGSFLPPPEPLELESVPPEMAATEVVAESTPEPADPNAVFHVEEMGEAMEDAWRRLRLSAPFRPLQYLSWEQGASEPFPVLRIHDGELLLTDDPWADTRLRLETDELIREFSQYDEDALPPSAVTGIPPVSLEEPSTEPALPPGPNTYFALDGSVSLVRKRFLHLYLDIEQREAVYADPFDAGPGGAAATIESDNARLSLLRASPRPGQPVIGENTRNRESEPRPAYWRIHSLKQNRQVKTGRMEYFDGPVISVLAYITPVSPDEGEN